MADSTYSCLLWL